jgi:hypothetical protein
VIYVCELLLDWLRALTMPSKRTAIEPDTVFCMVTNAFALSWCDKKCLSQQWLPHPRPMAQTQWSQVAHYAI